MARHKRIFLVKEMAFLRILRVLDNKDEILNGAQIDDVQWNFGRDTLEVKMVHEDFPDTPEGMPIETKWLGED